MYDEWPEVDLETCAPSVLAKFSNATGLVVTNAVVEELLHQLNAGTVQLNTDAEVQWCLEVLYYAFSLPLNSNYTIVSKSVQICNQWLACLSPSHSVSSSSSLPKPLAIRAEFYAVELLNHLKALFAFQWAGGIEADAVRRRLGDCDKALTRLKSLAIELEPTLRASIYPVMLRLLMSAVHNLLSFPFEFDGEMEILYTQAVSTLFSVWIQACADHYPSPSLWKTLHLLCHRWRHRVPVVEIWSRVCRALTNRVVCQLYGSGYAKSKVDSCDQELFVVASCSADTFNTVWFRVLTLFGNVGHFLRKSECRQSAHAEQAKPDSPLPTAPPTASSSFAYCYFVVVYTLNLVISDMLGVPCPRNLLVDASADHAVPVVTTSSAQTAPAVAQTGSFLRAAIKSGLPVGARSKQQPVVVATKVPPAVPASADLVRSVLTDVLWKPAFSMSPPHCKPTVNSVLRLVGNWLFELSCPPPPDAKDHHLFQPILEQSVEARAARAVASIALSKIFCSKLSQEEVCVGQCNRFFATLKQTFEEADPMIVSSTLVYTVDLFRVNLPQVDTIWPSTVSAIERLLSDAIRHQLLVRESCLQLSCLHILSSLIVYPFCAAKEGDFEKMNHLATSQWNILKTLLNEENDSVNLQMCIHLMAVHCVAYVQWSSRRKAEVHSDCMSLVTTTVVSLGEVLMKNKSLDFCVCLATYDALSAIVAVLPTTDNADDTTAYMQLLFVVCKVIEDQLALPARSHSRDMHSTVVAAFNFLELLLLRMPALLRNSTCLESVCSIVVLGLYGSEVENCQQLDKISKRPASQRVHDAADQFMHCLFCRVGDAFQTISSIESEAYLKQWLSNNDNVETVPERFMYILYNNTLLAVCELSDNEDEDRETAIIFRSPFITCTCHLYTLLKDGCDQVDQKPPPPHPRGRSPKRVERPTPSFFPADVDEWPKSKIDYSIPEMKMDENKRRMLALIKSFEQTYYEQRENGSRGHVHPVDVHPECRGSGTHRARLLLFDLAVTQVTSEPSFQLLNGDSAEFQTALANLDRTPSRHIATVHLFYVAKGDCTAQEILRHGEQLQNTNPCFVTFLSNLGQAVSIHDEALWTGHWSTAYGSSMDEVVVNNAGGGFTFDGRNHVIYWSSPCMEIAYVLPSRFTGRADACSYSSSSSLNVCELLPTRPPRVHKSSATSDGSDSVRQPSLKARRIPLYQDYKFLVVWLECFEDMVNLPVEQLVEHADSGERSGHPAPQAPDSLYLLYICLLDNGLYRLKFVCPQSKLGCAGPICDGLVLSLDLLAPLVRQSIVNAATRRRLEQEGYTSPAQRRRLKIVDIGAKFADQEMKPLSTEMLDELCSRFLINIPDSEKMDPVRACFQIELAHWFYLDHMCPPCDPKCGLMEFMRAVFVHCPFLKTHSSRLDEVIKQWREYKSSVPLYGTILINDNLDKVLLVQGYFAKTSWGFPKGKINENESPVDCAVRETLEEVGYDIGPLIKNAPYTERRLGLSTKLGLFLVRGVKENHLFSPMTKQEIRTIRWFTIDELPTRRDDYSREFAGHSAASFFMITPFIEFIRRMVRHPSPLLTSTPSRRKVRNRACSESIMAKFHEDNVLWSADGMIKETHRQVNGTPMKSTVEQFVIRMKPTDLFKTCANGKSFNCSTASSTSFFTAMQCTSGVAIESSFSNNVESLSKTNESQCSYKDEEDEEEAASEIKLFYPLPEMKLADAWLDFKFSKSCLQEVHRICADTLTMEI